MFSSRFMSGKSACTLSNVIYVCKFADQLSSHAFTLTEQSRRCLAFGILPCNPMNSYARNRSSSPEYVVKRRKLKHTSVDLIRKLICSEKGEAVQALHMVFEHESFTFETVGRPGSPGVFVSFLNLEGYSFIGHGNTKVASRSSACRVALQFLIDDLRNSAEFCIAVPAVGVPVVTDSSGSNEMSDSIASLVLSKYKWLKEDLKLPWFKMIAGIVMIRAGDHRNGEVVVLCTGSKCIEPKNVRIDGTVIIDSHAEVLVRRAFQHFLWSQLESPNGVHSILQASGTHRYSVKSEISFYLFVNSAPCGDSRIFAVSGKHKSDDKHPNRVSRGVLRIKLDGSNSTVPINNVEKYESTDRLMIMSCSDKLLKVNVLGLQGALLSNIIEPVFINGIVIGDLFHRSHVTRALYGRIEGTDFAPPFRLNQLTIHGLTKEPEMVTKSPKTSVNWIYGDNAEILNSTSGRTSSGQVSRLCKNSLFRRFLKLGKYENPEKNNSYSYFKKKAVSYQTMKTRFFDGLEGKNLGSWIKRKPPLDNFVLS